MSRVHSAIAPAVESASTPMSTMNQTSIAELPDFVTQGEVPREEPSMLPHAK